MHPPEFKDHLWFNRPFGGKQYLIDEFAYAQNPWETRWTGVIPHIDYHRFVGNKLFRERFDNEYQRFIGVFMTEREEDCEKLCKAVSKALLDVY